jgi:hypothetical protein
MAIGKLVAKTLNEFAVTACDWINFEQSDLKKTMELLLKDP